MRNVGVVAVGLLALIVAVACVPISEPGETGAVATAAPQPVATPDSDTPTPPAMSEPPTPAATEGLLCYLSAVGGKRGGSGIWVCLY